ncbi:MAG TPA: radical SAM family heme chaperone HemW, partial [Pirellulales bacterium]|nr:radical SAM family heme chaperone HemW [Pirellulales bacterium]
MTSSLPAHSAQSGLHPAARSAYFHVPFCAHRCGYCNFTLVARRDDLTAAYLQAVELELRQLGEPREVDTLFFGGGTPTHLSAAHLETLLHLARTWFPPAAGHEWSVEANPIDLNPDRVAVLAAAGVNRISLGAQSFRAEKLRWLERDHTAETIGAARELCRAFPSVSLDLIFASPGETLAEWTADLEAALALAPDHLSTYGLTIEKGSAFYGRWQRGTLPQAGEELEARLYAAAIDRLAAAGFEHYEVSNFARPGHRCRHNEVYWAGGEYYAVGPGAARHLNGRR